MFKAKFCPMTAKPYKPISQPAVLQLLMMMMLFEEEEGDGIRWNKNTMMLDQTDVKMKMEEEEEYDDECDKRERD
jgi:hypothetical protein